LRKLTFDLGERVFLARDVHYDKQSMGLGYTVAKSAESLCRRDDAILSSSANVIIDKPLTFTRSAAIAVWINQRLLNR
jgi:hypothetical protein